MKQPKITSKIIQAAVAVLFDNNIVVPNVYFGGFELDLAVITRDWFLAEVEVKIGLSDWKRDKYKEKWLVESALKTNYYRKRHKVTRFYYAVPDKLLANIPDFVLPEMGLIGVSYYNNQFYARIVRESRRRKQNRLNAKEINGLLRSMHFKIWKKHRTEIQNELTTVVEQEQPSDFHS